MQHRTRLLGKRSTLVSLRSYEQFVDDVNTYDREIYQCGICGFQFIHPPYTPEEIEGLYNQKGYSRFNEITYPFSDLEEPRAKKLISGWTHKFLSVGVREWLDSFVKKSAGAPTFLDVGCGRGHNSMIFKSLGFQVTAIDLSEIQIEYVRKRLDVEARKVGWEDLESGTKFDCILAAHLIEHTTRLHEFMDKMSALLKPDGLLILETPLTDDWGSIEHRYRDIYHTSFFDHFTLALLGTMHGLQYKESGDFMWRNDTNCIDIVASFVPKASLRAESMSPQHIESLRSGYGALQEKYLQLARDSLALRYRRPKLSILLQRAWYHFKAHGARATVERAAFFMREHYLRGSR